MAKIILMRLLNDEGVQEVIFYILLFFCLIVLTMGNVFSSEGSSIIGDGQYIWPTPGVYTITSKFGSRDAPTDGASSNHMAIDIAGPTGSPIHACADGTVTLSEYYGGYGWTVKIDHGNGMISRYSHNSENVVREGQNVKQGDLIAYMGSTGISTGSHLDLGFTKDDEALDPETILTMPPEIEYYL